MDQRRRPGGRCVSHIDEIRAIGWRAAITPYLKWTIVAMLFLGFASGLPLMMVFSKLSAWLREVGIDRSTIGGLYAVSFAYSLKFLWAPAVDRLPLPGLTRYLGQRRGWMLLAILGTIVGLVTIAMSSPSVTYFDASGAVVTVVEGLDLREFRAEYAILTTVVGALILAFSGATLDISVDAWRIESAPNDEQANMAAVYNLGYRLAIMFAGYGLVIAELSSFGVAYMTMATAMGVIAVLVLFFIREPERTEREQGKAKGFAAKVAEAVIQPFWQIVAKYRGWVFVVLAVVALYRISDFTMGVMAMPFYIDLGYSKATIGVIQGTFGPWPIIVGGFVGGYVAVRYSLLPALLVGGVLTLLTNGAFAALALAAGPGLDVAAAGDTSAIVNTPSAAALFGVIVADNLAAGYVGSVFIAYMSSLTDRKFAATQYALLSSAYSFFCKLAASTTSGPLSEAIGWAGFFAVTASYVLLPMALILVLMRYGPETSKGITQKREAVEQA